ASVSGQTTPSPHTVGVPGPLQSALQAPQAVWCPSSHTSPFSGHTLPSPHVADPSAVPGPVQSALHGPHSDVWPSSHTSPLPVHTLPSPHVADPSGVPGPVQSALQVPHSDVWPSSHASSLHLTPSPQTPLQRKLMHFPQLQSPSIEHFFPMPQAGHWPPQST